jgi:hypothetical protein
MNRDHAEDQWRRYLSLLTAHNSAGEPARALTAYDQLRRTHRLTHRRLTP